MSATRLMAIASLVLLGAAPAHGQLRAPRGLGNFPVVINTVTTGEVLVRWQPVLKASEYEVERCEGAALETCTMKTTPRLTANQLLQVPDNLSASGTYLYRVTAYGSQQLPIAQGQVGYQYTAPPSAFPVAPPTGTILPILAGPSALRAWSPIPGRSTSPGAWSRPRRGIASSVPSWGFETPSESWGLLWRSTTPSADTRATNTSMCRSIRAGPTPIRCTPT